MKLCVLSRWTWALAIFFTAIGCKRGETPGDAGGVGVVAEAVRLEASDFVAVRPDGGVEPEAFSGFSSDETRFAWSAYSVGAGAHVLTIVPVKAGERPRKWLLSEPAERDSAREQLAEGGFTPVRRLPREGAGEVKVELAGRTLRLVRISEKGEREVFFVGQPFERESGGFGVPDNASFWGLSPSGRVGVLEVVSANHPEFGSATSYVFVPIDA